MRGVIPWIAALAIGCSGESVTLELNFPSQATFVRVDMVEVYAVPLGPQERGRCPELTMQAEAETLHDFDMDSGAQPACDLLGRAGLELPRSPPGLHAYIAVAREGASALLSGCEVEDLEATRSARIPITLAITDEYRTKYPAGTALPTCSAAEKCGGCREP